VVFVCVVCVFGMFVKERECVCVVFVWCVSGVCVCCVCVWYVCERECVCVCGVCVCVCVWCLCVCVVCVCCFCVGGV